MDEIQKNLLEQVAGLHEMPAGAYNIRANGQSVKRSTTAHIHNSGDSDSRHDGLHSFYIGRNSHVKYVEKHYGSGDGNGSRIMNPQTQVEVGENSFMEMETIQIKGVDSTKRFTGAKLATGA